MRVEMREMNVRREVLRESGPNGDVESASCESGDLESSSYCWFSSLYSFLSDPARLPA